MTIAPPRPTLPRIACFHGGGSTAAIFAVQCARLSYILRDDFEFVFFDAPFERGPGPGVLPFFHDYAPFRSWFGVDAEGRERSDGAGYDERGGGGGGGKGGLERVYDMMAAEGEGGEWVGAMGFSQGCRVVGGLLREEQRCGCAEKERGAGLRFGVLCMGSRTPMESWAGGSAVEGVDLITTPTLHLHGLKDVNLDGGRQLLADHFDPKTATLYEIDYHHAMPWDNGELGKFAYLLKKMYRDTRRDEDTVLF